MEFLFAVDAEKSHFLFVFGTTFLQLQMKIINCLAFSGTFFSFCDMWNYFLHLKEDANFEFVFGTTFYSCR